MSNNTQQTYANCVRRQLQHYSAASNTFFICATSNTIFFTAIGITFISCRPKNATVKAFERNFKKNDFFC